VEAGLNVTETVQLEFPARLVPQVLVWLKSPGSAPPKTKLVTAIDAMLEFFMLKLKVLVLPTLTVPNPSEAGVIVKAVNPVRVRETVCGLPVALSVTLTLALRAPIAAGVNVTVIVQLAPCATALPQVFVSLKSEVSPVTAILLMLRLAVPLLVRVVVMGALGVWKIPFPNASDTGEN
jgi:hypothetical protein